MGKMYMKESMLVHNVYFSLIECSSSLQKKLVDDCYTYLKDHEGILYFCAGVLAEELRRTVNDTDFDVALTIVFENKDVHDLYQISSKHKEFLKKNKETWLKVRVFDSYVSAQPDYPIKEIPAYTQKTKGVISRRD